MVGEAPLEYDVMVVDGGGVITSAWAAARSNPDRAGRVLGAVEVMVSSLTQYSSRLRDGGRVVVAWDGEDNRAFRRGRHPWYKHGRGTSISRLEVRDAMVVATKLLQAAGIATVEIPFHEADDVVATVVAALKQDYTVLVVSDDKDYYQLVDDRVHLARRSMGGALISPAQARVDGIEIGREYLMTKAIMGDGGDNIKPLRQVGEVKARALVKAIPELSHDALHDPTLVLEQLLGLDVKLRAALINAGALHIHPTPFADPDFVASKYPHAADSRASDADCLIAAIAAIGRAYDLVTMVDSLDVGINIDNLLDIAPLPTEARDVEFRSAGIGQSTVNHLTTLMNRVYGEV